MLSRALKGLRTSNWGYVGDYNEHVFEHRSGGLADRRYSDSSSAATAELHRRYLLDPDGSDRTVRQRFDASALDWISAAQPGSPPAAAGSPGRPDRPGAG